MDEQTLGKQMLDFERNQVMMDKRPPLPCDGKLIAQRSKRWDRSEEIFWLIRHNEGMTTQELFAKVNFVYADFSASLRLLVDNGKLLVRMKGRAKQYFSFRKT